MRSFLGFWRYFLFVGGALLPLFVLAVHNEGLPHASPKETGISINVQLGTARPPMLPGPRPFPPFGAIVVNGFTSPGAFVIIERDQVLTATTSANAQGIFELTLTGILEDTYDFSFFAEDIEGVVSGKVEVVAVPIFGGATVTMANMVLPSTITVEEASIFPEEELALHGYSVPGSTILAFVDPGEESFRSQVLANGFWEIRVPGNTFDIGDYSVSVTVQTPFGLISIPSPAFPFKILSPFLPPDGEPILPPEEIPELPGAPRLPPPVGEAPSCTDLNSDGRVNLTDLSILLYHWGTSADAPANCNGDGVVDVVDFSIMMFWWTA